MYTRYPMEEWNLLDQMQIFLYFLNKRIPFAYGHFNDGELTMMMDDTISPLSLEQRASYELSQKLLTAFTHRQPNYFPGAPCALCYPELRKHADELRGNVRGLWHALSFHHTKTVYFRPFIESLRNRKLYWIINERHNLTSMRECGLDVSSTLVVPRLNAFDAYAKIFRSHDTFEDDSVVLLLCGCLGRVLAQEWFQLRPTITFLCLGSYFDSHILRKPHLYDNINHHKHCDECYNKGKLLACRNELMQRKLHT